MKKYFNLTLLFAITSIVSSFYVALKTNGHLFSTVSSEQMIEYGALNGATLKSDEIWKIFFSQLIHQKQLHMIFNVFLIWLLGSEIEKQFRKTWYLLFYWISGCIGILTSVFTYPEYVSSGSSQILMALFAAVFVMKFEKIDIPKLIFYVAIIGLILQLGADISVNHFPKAGHIAGFISGGIIGFFMTVKKKNIIVTQTL
ncbi:MAG: rhomboid family intramembrane serine protease [Pseudobdellovibrionaceae bacterium]